MCTCQSEGALNLYESTGIRHWQLDVLAAAHLTSEQPDNLTLFGIEPANLELGLKLSEEVAPQVTVTHLVKEVREELEKVASFIF